MWNYFINKNIIFYINKEKKGKEKIWSIILSGEFYGQYRFYW